MTSETIVLRTNVYDRQTDDLVRDLQRTSGRKVVIAVDETGGSVEVPADMLKIPVNPTRLGLYEHANFGWRCGDYFLYAAQAALPETEFFWLIEPDVRIHTERSASFFDGSHLDESTDFVTPWFVRSSSAWVWYKSIAPFYPNVNNCMMQLCRFSRKAATTLLSRRQALTREFVRNGLSADQWPNDEAFVGAVVEAQGLTIQVFADFHRAFSTRDTFTFTQPTSEKWLQSVPFNDRIYHPVVAGTKYHTRMKAFLANIDETFPAEKNIVKRILEEQGLYEQM